MPTTHMRARFSRASTIRLALAALLSVTGPALLSAQPAGRPIEWMSLNFRATNRTAHDATITRVESVDASGKTTNWSFGDRNQGGVPQGSSARLSLTAPSGPMTAAEQEGLLARIRGSTFRVSVRVNGETRVMTHTGRGATRTANFIELEFQIAGW